MSPPPPVLRSAGWTALVLVVVAPVVVLICLTLWRTPLPISEAVALLEDAIRNPVTRFLTPDRAYYRPLFEITLSSIWLYAPSLDAALASIRLLHVIPIVLLVLLLIAHLKPHDALEAGAAITAVAVLAGSPGFRDNLEIPLSYTIVGMPIALAIWILVNREPRRWHAAAILVLSLIAIGFKEQGLVVVPVVLAAWWMGAPGATRRIAVMTAVLGAAYVGIRLLGRGRWAPFEQAVGLGFREIEPVEAIVRFGAFPYFVYAYNGLATIANVLFSEPRRGVFAIVQHVTEGRPAIWEMIHLLSSAAMTATIAWWGLRFRNRAARERAPYESRLFIALIVALVACGVLSFNYSRDRLGGMATVFYAMAAYFAVRAAATHAAQMTRPRLAAVAAGLMLLAAGWNVRAATTVESARVMAARNQLEWLTWLPQRRSEFADRPVYLDLMQRLTEQGTAPDAPQPTRFPLSVKRTMGLP